MHYLALVGLGQVDSDLGHESWWEEKTDRGLWIIWIVVENWAKRVWLALGDAFLAISCKVGIRIQEMKDNKFKAPVGQMPS